MTATRIKIQRLSNDGPLKFGFITSESSPSKATEALEAELEQNFRGGTAQLNAFMKTEGANMSVPRMVAIAMSFGYALGEKHASTLGAQPAASVVHPGATREGQAGSRPVPQTTETRTTAAPSVEVKGIARVQAAIAAKRAKAVSRPDAMSKLTENFGGIHRIRRAIAKQLVERN